MMDEQLKQRIGAAIGRIPSGLFVLTAQHEDRRTGMLASWVQQVCFEPPMVSVAVAKGRPIMPLISESRRFGLCQLNDKDKVITRKFAGGVEPGDDPFLGFEMIHDAPPGVPILAQVVSWMTCELTCHMDVEGDHDLFVGTIRAGDFVGGSPHVHLRENGFKY
jgi:3-hydroxy-9,10-secoandrosta-1,3,5(10)-triene-9,17-dione monooxygenase reductase component